MTPRRVAITGIGMVTALGLTREENWTNLLNGTCGMGDVTVFPTEGFRSRIAAEVPYDRLKARLTPLQRRRWSRSDQFGLVAAMEAVADSGLTSNGFDPSRIGVLLGACTADQGFAQGCRSRGVRLPSGTVARGRQGAPSSARQVLQLLHERRAVLAAARHLGAAVQHDDGIAIAFRPHGLHAGQRHRRAAVRAHEGGCQVFQQGFQRAAHQQRAAAQVHERRAQRTTGGQPTTGSNP